MCGGGQRGASCLCALSFFMLPALIFFLIPSSHTLPMPQASGLQHTDSGERGAREGGSCLSQRHCLFCQYRERCRESCQWGTATGCRVQWAEGSPGAKVMDTVQFCAPVLCSLRSPSSGLKFLCEKQLPQCLKSGLLTPYNMGKCTPQLVGI